MKTVKVIGENVSSLHELVNSAIDDAYPFHSMIEYAILVVCIIHEKKKPVSKTMYHIVQVHVILNYNISPNVIRNFLSPRRENCPWYAFANQPI